jgi:hypothetical protein
VTTLPALQFDAARHVYSRGGRTVPGVTGVIRASLGYPFEHVAARVLEYAQQRGTAVHRACELDDEGVLDDATIDPRIMPYVVAWRSFRSQYPLTVITAETRLYSTVYGFAGTPDVVAMLPDDTLAVIDRKTGLPGIAARLQTAGYAQLVAELQSVDVRSVRRFALRMLPTGKYRFDEHTATSDWRDFIACLTVARLIERMNEA